MKAFQTILFVLLTCNFLLAQQQRTRTAAETLEMELAKQTAPIPEPPVDEKQPAAQAPTPNRQLPTVPPPLSEAAAEAQELNPAPAQLIPAPPVDEKQQPSQQTLPSAAAPAAPPQAPEQNRPSANADEQEAKQHEQNKVRAIPAPPVNEPKKDKSN